MVNFHSRAPRTVAREPKFDLPGGNHRMLRSLPAAVAFTAFAALSAVAAVAAQPAAAAGSGDVVVVRVGDGATALSSPAAPVFLDEYSQAGALVSSTPMPTSAVGTNRRLTMSGSATSEGALALSANGQYLTLAGYDANPGTASVAGTSSATVNRVVARVDGAGGVDTSTAIADAYTGTNVRAAVTDDGSRFWTAGAGGGVHLSSLGSSGTSTQINSTFPTNLRTVGIANGQLTVTTGSAPTGIYSIGNGLPTTGGQTSSLVAAATSPWGFVALDRDDSVPGVDTLYVADDSASPNGGILKYSFDGTTWAARGSFRPADNGVRGLTATVTPLGVTLFATTSGSPSQLYKVFDVAGYNANISATSSLLVTAAGNTALRGVAFAPSGSSATAPVIDTQPADATISSGQAASLSVTAHGTAPLHYQWYQGSSGDTSTPVGTDSANFTTPALSDTTSYWVRVSNDVGSVDSNTATVTVGPAACQGPVTSIGSVEGSGATSPLAGQTVTVRGVVVGDFEGSSPALGGFYLQDAGDGNDATSDGVFVFDRTFAGATVSDGDLVEVTGKVSEFQGQTEIDTLSALNACGTGDVTPTDVSLPMASATAFEPYEGMLVRFHQTLSVTEHFQLERFGEVVLSSGGRLRQPTAIVDPGAPAGAMQAANDLNRIKFDDDLNNQDPDPIKFGRNGNPLSAGNTLRGGDTVTDAVGVMTYGWAGNAASPNAYRLRPINALHGVADFQPSNPRPAGPPDVGGSIKVGGANLLNFFNDFTGCTFGVGGAPTDCRGAENATEYQRQLAKEVAALTHLDVDVLTVMEMENNGYGPNSAIQALVDALNANAGPGTWAFINPDAALGITNAAGDDAIKAAILYRTDRVTPVGNPFVDTGSSLWERRPVAQEFRSPTGRVTVVANHFKSKGSCPASGPDTDQGDGQSCWNAHRTDEANELLSFVNGTVIPATGDPDVLMLGDFNSYAKEDPVKAIEAGGYTNLVAHLHGDEAYSYAFDAQWGYLDYAFASPSLLDQVTGANDYHINADEPSALDYNTNFKTAGQIASLYAPDQFRTSDHDSVRVGLDLTDPTPPVVTPSVIGLTGNAGWYISDVLVHWTVSDPDSDVVTSGCDDATVDTDTAGTAITCTATSAGGPTTQSVTIMRDATAPGLTWDATIIDGARYVYGTVPAAPTCTASDSTSGPADCVVTGYSTAVGQHTLTATAHDVAGNTTTDVRTYTVDPYTLRGFYGSIDMTGLNAVKGGSSVPLQFEVFAGATELTSTSVVSSLTTTPVNCSTHAVTGTTTTVNAALRYDTRLGWFVYTWKTPKQQVCVRATVTTVDGSTLSALFQLK
jgi:predicted extracellular nuclease